jgi:ABC-type bacteriocin/lantibiotic exporter with double-glycine peptidase domain
VLPTILKALYTFAMSEKSNFSSPTHKLITILTELSQVLDITNKVKFILYKPPSAERGSKV